MALVGINKVPLDKNSIVAAGVKLGVTFIKLALISKNALFPVPIKDNFPFIVSLGNVVVTIKLVNVMVFPAWIVTLLVPENCEG